MIKQTNLYLIVLSIFFMSCTSNNGKYDERAVEYLDKLSETIGNLNSCSYTLVTIISEENEVEFTNEHDVYMRGPDKMHIHTNGTKGRKGMWYDGNNFAYFSYNKNVYDTVVAPGNIISAIDFLHEEYNIYFPAADFFYPTFTDDILDNFDQVLFMGDERIGEVDCVVIEGLNNNKIIHVWIEKDSYLPHKLSINEVDNSYESYVATFSNWRVNPSLPDMLFEFEPPTNSTREKFQSKN